MPKRTKFGSILIKLFLEQSSSAVIADKLRSTSGIQTLQIKATEEPGDTGKLGTCNRIAPCLRRGKLKLFPEVSSVALYHWFGFPGEVGDVLQVTGGDL